MVQIKSFKLLFYFSNKIDSISHRVLFNSVWWWAVVSSLMSYNVEKEGNRDHGVRPWRMIAFYQAYAGMNLIILQ